MAKKDYNDGGPAFPLGVQSFMHYGDVVNSDAEPGMSLRDWFATFAPLPTDVEIDFEAQHDRLANPHGDTYKPKRRSIVEIRAELRYRYADSMLAERKKS